MKPTCDIDPEEVRQCECEIGWRCPLHSKQPAPDVQAQDWWITLRAKLAEIEWAIVEKEDPHELIVEMRDLIEGLPKHIDVQAQECRAEAADGERLCHHVALFCDYHARENVQAHDDGEPLDTHGRIYRAGRERGQADVQAQIDAAVARERELGDARVVAARADERATIREVLCEQCAQRL